MELGWWNLPYGTILWTYWYSALEGNVVQRYSMAMSKVRMEVLKLHSLLKNMAFLCVLYVGLHLSFFFLQ